LKLNRVENRRGTIREWEGMGEGQKKVEGGVDMIKA
jgi:hypothetical protein